MRAITAEYKIILQYIATKGNNRLLSSLDVTYTTLYLVTSVFKETLGQWQTG